MAQRYLAVTSPGLEEMMERELRAMKVKRLERVEGGVEFDATSRGLYEVLLGSRVAHRVYLRMDTFRARDLRECYRKARRFEWERLLGEGAKVAMRGVVKESYIYGSGALVDAVGDGLRDRYAFECKQLRGPQIDRSQHADHDPDTFHLMARCDQDYCQLNLEATCGSLHLRGWRAHTGPAPMRETLAAAMLMACDWQPDEPLLDPMCGSGTFLIEAARLAAGLPPRLKTHRYGVERWASFDAERWAELQQRAVGGGRGQARIVGRDMDAKVIEFARENARLAGVSERITFEVCEVSEGGAPQVSRPGVVICNPPYGERLSEGGAIAALGERLSSDFAGWRAALLLPDGMRPPTVGSRWRVALSCRNGGIPVKLWTCTLGDPDEESEA